MIKLKILPQKYLKYFAICILAFYFNTAQYLLLGLIGFGKLSSHIELALNLISIIFFFLILFKLKNIWSGFTSQDRFLTLAFLIICIIAIIRSIDIPLNRIGSMPRFLGGNFYLLAWVTPFFIFLGNKPLIWKIVWNSLESFYYLFLICSPFLFFVSPYLFSIVLFIPIYLLNWDQLTVKQRYLVGYAYVICIVFFLVEGHRSLFVRFLYYPIIYFILLLFNRKIKRGKFFRLLTFFIIVLFSGAYLTYLAYEGQLSKYFSNPKIILALNDYEKHNFNSDSHSIVYEDFFLDFDHNGGVFFGRGVLGTTKSTQFINVQEFFLDGKKFENVFGFPIGTRIEVEGGYLMYILKVGVLGLFFMLFLAFKAIYLALFRSKNKFTMLMGYIIIEWLLLMYPEGFPQYSFSYILFWMSIGACLSKKMRNLSDNQIQTYIITPFIN